MTKRCLNMKTITHKEIEERVLYHSEKYANAIKQGIVNIENKELQKGRVMPREPMEKKILDSFKK